MIYFISAVTVLMMVDNCICSRINKKTIEILHTRAWQLEHLVTTMNYYNHIICLFPRIPDGVILTDRIKRVATCTISRSKRKLVLTTINNRQCSISYFLKKRFFCFI